jgi:putative copper resistance protein D
MPGFNATIAEREQWDLINLLRAFTSAEEAKALSPTVAPTPRLVAPDFRYGIGVGPGKTLKEFRGRAIIHLVLFSLPDSLPRLNELDRAWGQIYIAGARTLAVPVRNADQVYRTLGVAAANLPIAVEGSQEISEAYALFRRTAASEIAPPVPRHMEFLIDRQGYLRARWIPSEGPDWEETPRLLNEIERLDKETPSTPPPEEHVH